jgi:hypothetical protein
MSKIVKAYLTEYWRKKRLMNEESGHQFKDEIEIMSFFIHMGPHYKINDLVVVRHDGVEECEEMDYLSWTWKAKIMNIFVHEFMGVHEVFSVLSILTKYHQVKEAAQQNSPSSLL